MTHFADCESVTRQHSFKGGDKFSPRKEKKMTDVKRWNVQYDHKDGRSGVVEVVTEIKKSGGFSYGNGKGGALIVDGYPHGYDLRYCSGNLHMVMIKQYFGEGLIVATEI